MTDGRPEHAGWKLVPIEPTPAMHEAARHALKNYLYGLTVEERKALYSKKRKIYRVPEQIKHRVRYQAMLEAAPNCDASHRVAHNAEQSEK